MEKGRNWLLCPLCGSKTRVQLFRETKLFAFPLYCPKCKRETVVNVDNFHIVRTNKTQL